MLRRTTATVIALGLSLALAACSSDDGSSTQTVSLTGTQPNGTTYTLKIEREKPQDYSPNLTVTDRAGKKSVTLGNAVKNCSIPDTKTARVYKFTLSAESDASPNIYVDLERFDPNPDGDKYLYDIVFLNSVTANCVDGALLRKANGLPMQESGYVIDISNTDSDGEYAPMLQITAKASQASTTYDTFSNASGATLDALNPWATMPFLP